MNKKIQYDAEPLGEIELVPDFLPSRDELALKTKESRITISLSSDNVDFFKQEARKHHMQYQTMISRLLDEYVAQQQRR